MKHNKTIALLTAWLLCQGTAATAQTMRENWFDRIGISLTGGTTGVGFDLAVPAGDYVRLRAGYSFMPHMEVPLNFGIQVGDDPATSASKFASLSQKLADLTGHEVNDNIDVIGQPIYHNFKLLVDVFPFRKKEWHFTAGFYVGPRKIARAYNTTEDMPTLFSVKMYNTLYERFSSGYYDAHPFFGVADLDPAIQDKLLEKLDQYGRMGVHIGDYAHDVYYTAPEYYAEEGWDAEGNHHMPGDLKHDTGDLKAHKGDTYLMEPDDDSMVKAYVYTNAFKPYLGLGYDKAINRRGGRPSGWALGFDAGIWLWGGTPSVLTHDGTDMAKDLVDVRGKVGRYVETVKAFKVFPVIDLKFTYTINLKK